MSVDTDTGASLPTLKTPYWGFGDPSPSHISIMKYFVFLLSGLPNAALRERERGERQELRSVNPSGECSSLGLFHGSPPAVYWEYLLML